MAARLVVSFATPLTGSRDVTITNGTSAVSLSISGGASVALRPKDAWDVAVALLNAAANVREGHWGGPEYGDVDRAVAEINRKKA